MRPRSTRLQRAGIGFSLLVTAFLLFSFAAPRLTGDPRPPRHHLTPKTYKGRVIAPTMSYLGADWLERAERDGLEQPDQVLDTIGIPPGSTVADIGAGTGYYSLRLAKRVGPHGRVLATDIQPEMLSLLQANMKKAGLTNIETILTTPTDAKLPVGQLDLALLVDVYHELANPEETMTQVRQAVKTDGRLVLIEYRGEDPTVPIKPEHKLVLARVRAEIEPMGFRLQRVFDFLPRQHLIIFVPAATGAETK